MLKFIKHSIFFSGFAFLLYLFFIYVWGKTMPSDFSPNFHYIKGANGHMYSRAEEVKQTHDIDILVIGSSHAYRGFDPRIFESYGFEMFNLGSSSQSPWQTKVLLERYFSQLNPKMVIYEVYPRTLLSDGVEASMDLLSNDKNDFKSLKMAVRLNHTKVYNTFFYASIDQLLNIESFEQDDRKGNDLYIDGGYVEKDFSTYKYDSVIRERWPIGEDSFEGFNEIIDFLESENVELYAVFAPITKAMYNSQENTNTYIKQIEKRTPLYNFNTILNLDDSLHFYDPHHMNQKGVEIFNKVLIESILLDR